MTDRGTRRVSKRLTYAALLLPLPVLFVALGSPSLWDPDEGRHAEIARAMLHTGDWFLPRLNLEPYYEKLPAFYWILAASYQTFGLGEWASRFPSAFLGLVGIWLTVRWGARHVGAGTGALAGIMLATTGGYVGAARLATPDASYAVALSMGLLSAAHALFRSDPPNRGAVAPWAWLALATVLRGPIALVLAGLVLAPLMRRPDFSSRLRPLRGAGIVAALVAPMVLGCLWTEPGYLWSFLVRTNLGSFVGTAGNTAVPLLYYFWMLPLLFLPWSVFLPGLVAGELRSRHRDETRRFLVWWVLVVLGVFTVARAKMPGYVLPALPPLALLTANWAATRLRLPVSSPLRDPLLATGAVICVTLLVAPWIGLEILERIAPPYAEQWIYLLWLVPVAAPGAAAVALGNRPGLLAWIGSCSAVVLLGAYVFGSDPVSRFNSLETPAELVVREMPPDARLLSYHTEAHSLAFYSGRPVLELADAETGATILDGPVAAALFTKERHLETLRRVVHRPLYVWWVGESRKFMLVNRPRRGIVQTPILLPEAPEHENFTSGSSFRNTP